jgi:hypothetical protein
VDSRGLFPPRIKKPECKADHSRLMLRFQYIELGKQENVYSSTSSRCGVKIKTATTSNGTVCQKFWVM